MCAQVGGKGHGLFCTAPLRRGEFVIEYVGEIVNGTECDRRIQEYARSDHFYLMSLRGDDSIDATRKGNLSRFINHACAPNCETQKWDVAGRPCVGIFTLHDLPADTEITFDYKYERYGGKKQASVDMRTMGCTRSPTVWLAALSGMERRSHAYADRPMLCCSCVRAVRAGVCVRRPTVPSFWAASRNPSPPKAVCASRRAWWNPPVPSMACRRRWTICRSRRRSSRPSPCPPDTSERHAHHCCSTRAAPHCHART